MVNSIPARQSKGRAAAKDLTGKRFGRLVALRPTGARTRFGNLVWMFQCDCGKTVERDTSILGHGTQSCGCMLLKNSGQFPSKDLAGLRVGVCTAIEPTDKRTKGGYTIWKIQCDCGKIFERPAYNLLRGTCKSCGCQRTVPIGRPRIPENGAHVNILYLHYRTSARHRKIEFSISKDFARAIFESNCAYCGASPSVTYTNKNLSGEYAWNGIDRIDSTKGYTPENCVSCCTRCNWGKGAMTVEAFKAWIKAVYSHLNL